MSQREPDAGPLFLPLDGGWMPAAHCDGPWAEGALVSRASLLRIRGVQGVVDDDDPQVPPDAPPPDTPEEMTTAPPFDIDGVNFMSTATEIRAPEGAFGRGLAWFCLRVEVVPGVPPSPVARAAAAADFGNGLSSPRTSAGHPGSRS